MTPLATLRVPGEIIYGSGCTDTIGDQVRKLNAARVLLVSDRGLERAGLVAQMQSRLEAAGLSFATFLDVETEPSLHSVQPCADFARGADVRAVIGLGGGSALDTAKTAAMLLTNGGTVEDYLGTGLVERPGLPTILIPTTAGTGAEVTPNALFYIPARRTKEAIVSPHIVPQIAMIDPLLTLSVPPAVTAATGLDALCHAIESYTGNNATPLTELFSREAIALIGANLRPAVIDGQNLKAREGMALGSLYAAIAIANAGTNAVHALAYPLQGLNRVTHGVANSLLLPYVVEFNLLGDVEKFAQVAALMGVPTAHLSPRDAAAESARACRQLSVDIGIPQTLREVGVCAEHLDGLVEGALAVQRLLKNNPRAITAADIKTIFERAL